MTDKNLKPLASLIEIPKSGFWGDSEATADRKIRVSVVTNGDAQRSESIQSEGLPIRYFSESEYRKSKLVRGDIVITTSGEPGSVARMITDEKDVVASNFIKVLKARPDVDSSWLFYMLNSAPVRKQLNSFVQHSVIANLSTDCFERVQILEIKKADQQKIASILSIIDAGIEKTNLLIEKYRQMKIGMMQDLFHYGVDRNGRIRNEKTHKFKKSILGSIPVEWDVELLDVLCQRGSGHTPSKSHPEYYNGGIKWVSLADTNKLDDLYIRETEYQISKEGIKNSSAVLHPAGTVLISRDAAVGKSAIMYEPMAVSQHFIVWRCGERLNNYYLYYWLQNDKRTFEAIAFGTLNYEMQNESVWR